MFGGTATALITPFKDDGSVDEDGLRRLVDFKKRMGRMCSFHAVPQGNPQRSVMKNISV